MSFLNVEQKKGDRDLLDGRLTVFSRVEVDISDIMTSKHPISSMVHNGLLVVQGNYKEQNNLRDFLKSEMGVTLEDGLGDFLEKLDGLESALDPDKLKEKMESLGDIQEFIPTPAKIVPFNSESEILAQEGDIFYTGNFKNVANANLSVNSFPIFYQARFREQQIDNLKYEIETLIGQVENDELPDTFYSLRGVNVEQKLLKDFLPYLLYCRKEPKLFGKAATKFRNFLNAPQFSGDVEKIIGMLLSSGELSTRHYTLMELYARRIIETNLEDKMKIENITRRITEIESDSSAS
jgi:hypothetical protein